MPTVIAVQSRKICPALQRVNGVEAEGLREFTGRLTILRCSVNPEIADEITAAITIECQGASVPCHSRVPKRLNADARKNQQDAAHLHYAKARDRVPR
jgi:hypothetical protein